MAILQSVPLFWQIYQQIRSIKRIKVHHKDHQDFKSIFDETQVFSALKEDSDISANKSTNNIASFNSGEIQQRRNRIRSSFDSNDEKS